MNNIELENKVKEILAEENFFDMMGKAYNFEKEYKQSDFYKSTKMPLFEVLKAAKMHYTFNLNEIFKNLQEKINSLDFTNLQSLLEQVGDLFENENNEIMESLQNFKELM